MACNENVVKNMANEITRNCQAQNVTVDTDFIIYLIDLLLLNPKYGKLFSKTISRNNLQFFVDECVNILIRGGTSLNTLKMQFLLQSNYDKLENLVDKHIDSIESCLRPLVSEILEEDPEPEDENEMKKLFRKISIYIILASGLGNPGIIMTLKEGMAALESIFSLDDLKLFLALPRPEKMAQLTELMEVASGVRLFNRDCKKGGEGIPDLPFNLVDAGKACLTSLSNSLITVMQRVNTLSTAVEDCMAIEDETGNVCLQPLNSQLLKEDYKELFDLLAFYRQYEVITRKLLTDVQGMVTGGSTQVLKFRAALQETHAAVKYKAAVPTATVFPLFSKLWQIWRAMQNVMYLVSLVSRLLTALGTLLESAGAPRDLLTAALQGRKVCTDQVRTKNQDRIATRVRVTDRLSLCSLTNYVAYNESYTSLKDRHVQYLGFCAVCLCGGALIPSNMRVGVVKCGGKRYAFCSVKMAARFSKEPQRYINEVIQYARDNPHIINLLNIVEDVFKVKDINYLLVSRLAKIKVLDKDVQTLVHPIEEYIEKDYTWDLWEWKRRACQWATIVNCRTHSTQTDNSHLRSDTHCQTHELRDKIQQTKQDCGVNTVPNNVFLWGMRGQLGYGQHSMALGETVAEKKKAQVISTCSWPCFEPPTRDSNTSVEEKETQ